LFGQSKGFNSISIFNFFEIGDFILHEIPPEPDQPDNTKKVELATRPDMDKQTKTLQLWL
jgi:hypothetical protein